MNISEGWEQSEYVSKKWRKQTANTKREAENDDRNRLEHKEQRLIYKQWVHEVIVKIILRNI